MTASFIYNPSASIARGIEDLIIKGENSNHLAMTASCRLLSRAISVTVFPTFLTLELLFKRVPKLLLSIPFTKNDQIASQKFHKNIQKIEKFCLGIFFSPLGMHSPDGVSGLFLKNVKSNRMIRPFGVEAQYGRELSEPGIQYPESIEQLQELIKQAKRENKQVSVIGAGMSQGPQTVPTSDNCLVINMSRFKSLTFSEDNQTATVQAGATWEEIQIEANKRGMSVIVKQASDLFTVGGSIGINCHGWAHKEGAIASTVEAIDIIDANGDLRTLTPDNEMFGCLFGTLGYFGIIVSARLKLTANEHLIERTTEVSLDEFITHYKTHVKDQDIPLFGGRLVLDDMDGNPLRQVCMVSYEKDPSIAEAQQATPVLTQDFVPEPKVGTRIERIALQALSRLSYFTTRRLINKFWSQERQAMLEGRKLTRNEALHPPINAFRMLQNSNLHAQWLQEYFIKEENLPNFLRFLGAQLKANEVRLINATIRPTPQDNISVLPYAEQDRYAVVICFSQLKTEKEMERTKNWIQEVNQYLINQGDIYYQAYMPYATKEQFEQCYGAERVANLRRLKQEYDPSHVFSNGHTQKYYDAI